MDSITVYITLIHITIMVSGSEARIVIFTPVHEANTEQMSAGLPSHFCSNACAKCFDVQYIIYIDKAYFASIVVSDVYFSLVRFVEKSQAILARIFVCMIGNVLVPQFKLYYI